MKKLNASLLATAALLALMANAYAADQFANVKCGEDIPKALIGHHSTNERIAVSEARHKDIGLKALGTDEVGTDDAPLYMEYWMICGKQFVLLDTGELIRDAMELPAKAGEATPNPDEYTGACKIDQQPIPGTVFAFLNKDGTVKTAWRIDRKKGFVKLAIEGRKCE